MLESKSTDKKKKKKEAGRRENIKQYPPLLHGLHHYPVHSPTRLSGNLEKERAN
jgi:hypothetical protein